MSSEEVSTRGGGEAGTNYRGPESDYVANVFVFLGSIIIYRFYKLTISDQVQGTLQLRVSHSI
jgi:hypothetical protein